MSDENDVMELSSQILQLSLVIKEQDKLLTKMADLFEEVLKDEGSVSKADIAKAVVEYKRYRRRLYGVATASEHAYSQTADPSGLMTE